MVSPFRYTDEEIHTQIRRYRNRNINTPMHKYKHKYTDAEIQMHNKGTSLFQVVSPFRANTRHVQAQPDLKWRLEMLRSVRLMRFVKFMRIMRFVRLVIV